MEAVSRAQHGISSVTRSKSVRCNQCADSDEVAQAFRNEAAQRSDMMPPGAGTSLAGDLCHWVFSGSIAGALGREHVDRRRGENCP
jgi:hypothetical protein